MPPIGGHTTGLSPDLFQKAINAVIYERYMRDLLPDALSARDDFFFRQSQASEMVYVWDEDSNIGPFNVTEEQEDIANDNTSTGNQKTARQVKYMKQIPISFEAMKTEQEGMNKRQELGTQIADRAMTKQDETTLQETYGDAYAGSVNTTPDGDAWASDSHTTLKGFTVDTLETGVLNADNLWTVVQSLANQLAQDGEPGGQQFEGILVPFRLLKAAHETLDSDLIPFSGENQVNFYQTLYGGRIRIAGSIYLDSTYNSATNAATSYHVVSKNTQAARRVLTPFTTRFIPEEYSPNDTALERAKFLESHMILSWFGAVHSNGTA